VTSDDLRKELLSRLRDVEKLVRADLLAQYRSDPALLARALQRLRDEESELAGKDAWLETFAGRAAVLYILKSLYVRVLEDQRLLTTRRIRDGGSYQLFRTLFPQLGYAAYLRTVFAEAERALPELFARTPVEIAEPNEGSASAIWAVWQEAAAGGGPLFDFRGDLATRFIGDLYQDLDPDVKARYALLQTPRFVEEFILDRTLTPALAEFGLHDFRIIDPTCGSGHFLLGAFKRLFQAWREELGSDADARLEAARRALVAVYGAGLNEYACALSRFRLLLAVVRTTDVVDLEQLRTLHVNVITCDSLIPWERISHEMLPGTADVSWLARYGSDNERTENEAFFSRGFHAVVGNPPYIAVKDRKKREDYKRAWPRSARGKYSLSAPMTERFLLLPAVGGYTGLIVGSNFSKAEFGKGVITNVMRDVQLDLVIDTSGASLPGHATPTVIMLSKHSKVDVKAHQVVIVASKRGGPSDLPFPEAGAVWKSIGRHCDSVGFDNEWIDVQALHQSKLVEHPWTLGTAANLSIKARLDEFPRLRDLNADSGPAVILIEDEAFIRRYAGALPLQRVVFGDDVRDWEVRDSGIRVVSALRGMRPDAELAAEAAADLWSMRSTLFGRPTFGGHSYRDRPEEKTWWQFHQIVRHRVVASPRIAIGEITADNQFVYDSSDAIFTRAAPVLTLPQLSEARCRDVAAVLNSSSVEFWFKCRCRIKNGWGEPWELQYVRNAENVLRAPLPERGALMHWSGNLERAHIVEGLTQAIESLRHWQPSSILRTSQTSDLPSRLMVAQEQTMAYREQLVALQEELDWTLYRSFGLVDDVPLLRWNKLPQLQVGHRPFEIALARRIASGEEESAWFKRQSLISTTEISERYQGAMREVLEKRLALIETDPTIGILEQPVYKRRWTFEPWESMLRNAAVALLLERLDTIVRCQPRLLTTDELIGEVRSDAKSIAIAEYAKFAKDADFGDTLTRLLANESIPDNPARLLTAAGLAKLVGSQTADVGPSGVAPRVEPFADGEAVDWKRVWRLQEREDAGETVSVAVPLPFKNGDYAHPNGWRIRGKFNIANERFIVYDGLTPKRYAWGGWTTAERARLSSEAFDLRDREPDGASALPTLDDPRRCGIQFPLWDKLDELRRTNDPGYGDVAMLAQLCGRACPCDVLDRWRDGTRARRKGRPATNGKPPKLGTPNIDVSVLRDRDIDPTLLEAAFSTVQHAGSTGLAMAALEPLFSGDRSAAQRAIERLRVDGRVEVIGHGRGRRYRVGEPRLL